MSDNKPQESTLWSGAGMKAAIVLALAAAVGAVLYAKNQAPATAVAVNANTDNSIGETVTATPAERQPPARTGLPRLVDLGASKCIPCKMMAPILEELKKTYAGKLDVTFIDVWEKPDEAKQYGINLIPTQIFFDAAGQERFRHEGFFSREDILAKWKELGVDLGATAPAPAR